MSEKWHIVMTKFPPDTLLDLHCLGQQIKSLIIREMTCILY